MTWKPDEALAYIATVERGFAALTRASGVQSAATGAEPHLGGKLLWAGELDESGRAMVVSGNVAGVATLAATANPESQRALVREGIVDFLVTSLDEALRILKNEIRKHETVAVCVSREPAEVLSEMSVRGVQPDFAFGDSHGMPDAPSVRIRMTPDRTEEAWLSWRMQDAPARWMPVLDVAAAAMASRVSWTERWLRLAPRYCGRRAEGVRLVHCDLATAQRVAAAITSAVHDGATGALVTLRCSWEKEEVQLSPELSTGRNTIA